MQINPQLPSLGKLYKTKLEDITLRTLKGRDEKLLAEMNVDNIDKRYSLLLKNVLTGIDPNELTLGDRAWIILWLRANSFSPIIPVNLVCGTCYQDISLDVNITDINVKELDQNYQEPIEVKLSESTVKLRILRIADEIKIAEWEKRLGASEAYMYRWALSIVNDKDVQERIIWLENQDSRDIQKIRMFQDDHAHGPELDNVKYVCPKCGSEGVMTLPFRPNFLIPTREEIR